MRADDRLELPFDPLAAVEHAVEVVVVAVAEDGEPGEQAHRFAGREVRPAVVTGEGALDAEESVLAREDEIAAEAETDGGGEAAGEVAEGVTGEIGGTGA